MEIILASASPRRRELLGQIDVTFKVYPSSFEEDFKNESSIEGTVMALAFQKGLDVARDYEDDLVISADTIVTIDGEILGKPLDREEAFMTLRRLSGRTHKVLTGMSLLSLAKDIKIVDYVETEVEFYPLSDDDIENYLEKAKPYDKAGSYGIQGLGALLVKEIRGDYNNVVGLPISRLGKLLEKHVGLKML